MNFIPNLAPPVLDAADALLMDVARRLQLTRTHYQSAEGKYLALCSWVDREDSPLHGLVRECYASGSFATGTAIMSKVKTSQHDVDVVLELDLSPTTDPETVLRTLFEAINGEEGSRYHGMAELNSRCVTVHYADGTTVDLMPVARIGDPPRAGHLFHFKLAAGEVYHKPVNPFGFANHFNEHTKFDPAFSDFFRGRRILVEGNLVEADVQPMPDQVPISEKSARVVALQLLKRDRDLAYRKRHGRKPPSVALSAMALEIGSVQPKLTDEVISIAAHIRRRLTERAGPRGTVQVFNPSYSPDEFTDRWPENWSAQANYDSDLRTLISDLHILKSDNLSLHEKQELLERHFGETASHYAINSQLEAQEKERKQNRLRVSPAGKILAGGAAAGASSTAARAATRSGGAKHEK